MARFYLFAYYQALRDLRLETRPVESQIHKVRDALMSGGLFPILAECGYQYGGTVLNLPAQVVADLRHAQRLRSSMARIDGSDLILLTTRPPLDDGRNAPELEGKRKVLESGHDLERSLFRRLRAVF